MSAIAHLIPGRERDLGGFTVRRILPGGPRQMVGPFIFLDEMGPATFLPGAGVDVRPHPHIGLATVTWLFEGELLHRDSLGFVQPIRPGEVNWMTAGSGIAHSERTPPGSRQRPSRLHGMQSWVALPQQAEETAPAFHHYGTAALPTRDADGVHIRVIAGTMLGLTSPVRTFSPMGYAALDLAPGAALRLPPEYPELGVYVVDGSIAIDGEAVPVGTCAVLASGARVTLEATAASRCMILGGEPADGPRHIWWNFVSSSEARLERAREDWRLGRFAPVPGETEFIPLPER